MKENSQNYKEYKTNRFSYRRVQQYVKKYAENCRYSFNRMLSL